ncbi:MAG: DUF2795 domain-containing protein [Dehalococcoidia bacterium]|nr:DUF2795 domain-containing protein [Dehalococcoidia bacterium]
MANEQSGINPAQLQQYLGDINFPVEKQQLIDHAQQRGAGEQALQALRGLPNQRFNSPTEVSQAMSQQA